MLYLGSIGMDRVISELCYKGTILQRNYRKMTIKWSFSYNSFVKFHGTKIWESQNDRVIIQFSVITRRVIKGLYCNSLEQCTATVIYSFLYA